MAMYGGDEISAVVVDLGGNTCKAGYAGEDLPKAYFPSAVGVIDEPNTDASMQVDSGDGAEAAAKSEEATKAKKRRSFVGNNDLFYRRDTMEVVPAYSSSDGLLEDWDAVESIYDHALRERLMVNTNEYAVLLAEPTYNTAEKREKMVELMFEKFSTPATFVARNSVLAAFSMGRQSALVVDGGSTFTTVSAVYEGFALNKSVVQSPIGGDVLTECMVKTLKSKDVKLRPLFSFKKTEIKPGEYVLEDLDLPGTTASYTDFMQKRLAADVKEAVCRVPDSAYADEAFANVPTVSYDLPDGQTIEVGSDRFRIADLPFQPELIKTIPSMESFWETRSLPGQASPNAAFALPNMVASSINRCDVDVRRDLFNNILLTGGTMCLQQMKERVEREVVEIAPSTVRVKVVSSGSNTERKFSVWIGGSILASLGTFQQMWFSKSEYEEHGASYVHRKCP